MILLRYIDKQEAIELMKNSWGHYWYTSKWVFDGQNITQSKLLIFLKSIATTDTPVSATQLPFSFPWGMPSNSTPEGYILASTAATSVGPTIQKNSSTSLGHDC